MKNSNEANRLIKQNPSECKVYAKRPKTDNQPNLFEA